MRRWVVAVILAAGLAIGCGGSEDESEQEDGGESVSLPAPPPAEPGEARDVAKYLDRELGFDFPLTGNSEQVTTAFEDADVQIRVYDSEEELRRGQREVEKLLGDLAPTTVTCGVVEVSVAADETPDRPAVEDAYAEDLDRAMDQKYGC